MRCAAIVALLVQAIGVSGVAAQPAKGPRLDVHGDPLPDGALVRLGTVRFQPPGPDYHPGNARFRFRIYGREQPSALAPDGASIATILNDDQGVSHLYFLDTATGKSVHKHDLKNVGSLRQFTPDGKSLVFVSSGIKLVDAATGKVTRSIEIANTWESQIALIADAKWVAVQPQKYLSDAPVGIWDTSTGKEVVSLPGRGAVCKGLAFGPEGKRLLLWSIVPTKVDTNSMSYGSESKVVLACIDVATRKIVGETIIGYADQAALSPDGETVAVETPDRVRIVHLPTSKERCIVRVKGARFMFTPDGKGLVTIDEAGRATLWDTTEGKKTRDLEGALTNKDFVIVGVSKDGGTIAALDGGWQSASMLVVWKADTGKRVGRPAGHEGAVTCIAYAPGGKGLASGSLDRTVRLWDPATGEQVRVLTVHKGAVTAVAVSPNGKLVASSSDSGVTRVSTLAEGKLVSEFTGPAKGASVLAFSHDSKSLFAGGNSPEILGWDIAGAREVLRLKTGDDGAVMALGDGGAVALTANGEIRAEDAPERIQIWEPMKKKSIASLVLRDERGGGVRCEAAIFSQTGRLMASSQISEYQGIRPSYGAAQLRIWERSTGQPIRTLAPTVTRLLAFSPNVRLLAAGATGRSGHLSVGFGSGIDIWDTVTGKKAGTLPVTPECIAFSPDGKYLATGGRDHGVLIWEAPNLPPLEDTKEP